MSRDICASLYVSTVVGVDSGNPQRLKKDLLRPPVSCPREGSRGVHLAGVKVEYSQIPHRAVPTSLGSIARWVPDLLDRASDQWIRFAVLVFGLSNIALSRVVWSSPRL